MHQDLVQREFTTTRANQLSLTNLTGHWTDEGRLNLCAIKDSYSKSSSDGVPGKNYSSRPWRGSSEPMTGDDANDDSDGSPRSGSR